MLKLGETGNQHGLIHRSLERTAYEGRDRRGHAGDRVLSSALFCEFYAGSAAVSHPTRPFTACGRYLLRPAAGLCTGPGAPENLPAQAPGAPQQATPRSYWILLSSRTNSNIARGCESSLGDRRWRDLRWRGRS